MSSVSAPSNAAGSLPPEMRKASLHLRKVLTFLSEIGLPWRAQVGAKGFISGVDIKDGTLLIDPTARPSNVLHEAGHLATLPGEFRRFAQRNVGGVQKMVLESIDFSDPDGPLQRAALQCSDPEATAWAWAAGEHLGLPPKVIIKDDEYDGEGAFIRAQVQHRGYLGINGLAHAGFCATRPGSYAKMLGLPGYPKLAFWLQRDFGSLAGAAATQSSQASESMLVTTQE